MPTLDALADATAFESWKAARIRDFLAEDLHPDVRDAARILPLVGWDVELATMFLAEELEDEVARDERLMAAARRGKG